MLRPFFSTSYTLLFVSIIVQKLWARYFSRCLLGKSTFTVVPLFSGEAGEGRSSKLFSLQTGRWSRCLDTTRRCSLFNQILRPVSELTDVKETNRVP